MTLAAPRPTLLDLTRPIHDGLDLPEVWKSEILDGQIVLSRRPDVLHADIASRLSAALRESLDERRWAVLFEVDVDHPAMNGVYSPDLLISPRPFPVRDTGPNVLRADALALAGEITSPSTADRDRTTKRDGLARAGVPLYLLIDRERGESRLYAEPEDGRYAIDHGARFGRPIHLPEPFDVEIDTSFMGEGDD
jgi:Uma2 family endonuclease